MTVYNNFPLSNILYYKIGGKAKWALKIQNRADLSEALEFIRENQIKKILPVGLGSNLLVSDKFFDGAVLWFCKAEFLQIKLDGDGLVSAFAGEKLDDLIQFCFKNNLRGLEWAGGLPSTVGAAVRGNVGAFGSEIKESVEKVKAFELLNGGKFLEKELKAKDLNFSYRTSLIKQNKNLIVADVFFKLHKTDSQGIEEAKKIYFQNIGYRKEHHPMEYPSCGSVFKNITDPDQVSKVLQKWPDIQKLVAIKWHNKVSMGYTIKRLGFSNLKIGGAQVSEKHANYIVNINNARSNDVIGIIERIRDKFSKTFGFLPETEIEIIDKL